VISKTLKLLAIGIMVFGVTSHAYACGDEKKDKSTSASYSSTEKAEAGCCASKSAKASKVALTGSSKEQCATKMTSAECAAKMAKGECSSKKMSSASLASTAGGDHCATGSKASKVAGNLTYGESTVTMAGACPAKNEADYAFYVSGAECKGTGTSVAHTVKALKGVASVTVDYDNHMVYVCADGKAASKQAIEKSLKNAGYDQVKFVNASKQNCSKSHGKVEA
jgi:copper chaperone CopZ